MKKLSFIIAILLLIVLVGCQSDNGSYNVSTELNGNTGTNSSAEGPEHLDPPEYIGVRSIEQLDEMRLKLQCSDEELSSYLLSVEGGGADSREDLEGFLELVASVPNPELVGGDISWIAYFPDSNIVYVSTVGSTGEWSRVEYFIGVNDVSGELEKLRAEGQFDKSTISDVVRCKAGRVKVYSEVKEPHPSGTGNTVEWMLTIDNTFARVVYYTDDSTSNVQASYVFENANLTQIAVPQAHVS